MLRRGAPTIVLVPLLAAGIAVYAFAPGPPAPPALGMVRATEIRVAPEVSGRLLALPVKSGGAERDRVYAGPRREQVEMLDREVQKTQSNVTLAEQQFARVSALAANQHAS